MPTTPHTLERRIDGFRDQRRLSHKVIETVGSEFDQLRLQYYSAPMSPDHLGPVWALGCDDPLMGRPHERVRTTRKPLQDSAARVAGVGA